MCDASVLLTCMLSVSLAALFLGRCLRVDVVDVAERLLKLHALERQLRELRDKTHGGPFYEHSEVCLKMLREEYAKTAAAL